MSKWSLKMPNKKTIFETAKRRTPQIPMTTHPDMLRHDIANKLVGGGNIGIELGVAEGVFSKRMLQSGKFTMFYGVDVYGDTHDTDEYVRALKHVGIDEGRYKLLRMDFESALQLFPDNYFDLIYIDGFAHTGEEGGKTIIDWFEKLKDGGLFAGDDYHDDWPLVKWAVNHFAHQTDSDLHVTGQNEDEKWCQYPTWFLTKKRSHINLSLDCELFSIAQKEKQRIHSKRLTKLRKIARRQKTRELLRKLRKFLSAGV